MEPQTLQLSGSFCTVKGLGSRFCRQEHTDGSFGRALYGLEFKASFLYRGVTRVVLASW